MLLRAVCLPSHKFLLFRLSQFFTVSLPLSLETTMVFTVAQTTAFFINEIGIPQESYIQLQAEGVTTIDDLGMMNGKAIDAIADNFRKPADRIPNPDPDALEGSTIPRPHTFLVPFPG